MVDNVKESISELLGPNLTDEEKDRLTKDLIICDDERMPYSDDYPVDIILNVSGAIRRLNPEQLIGIEINFIAERLQLKIREMKTREEKEETIFKFLNLINAQQADFFRNIYDSYDETLKDGHWCFRMVDEAAKDAFIKSIEDDGFYLVRPPHKPLLYDDVARVYEAFPDIKPIPLYVDLFGIKHRRILNDGIVGWKYMIVLKQNSNKNFSARSTFRVNRVNLPAKDITKKTNRSAYAKSPIQLSEIYNLMSSISGRTLAEYDVFTRSSALGRKSLDRILETDGNPLSLKKIKLKGEFVNTNADILAARLKCIGIKINYRTSKPEPAVYEDAVGELHIGRYIVYDSPKNQQMYEDLFAYYTKRRREVSYIESYPGEGNDLTWEYVFGLDQVKEMNLSDDTKKMLKIATSPKGAKVNQIVSDIDSTKDDEDENIPRRRARRKKKIEVEDTSESETEESDEEVAEQSE